MSIYDVFSGGNRPFDKEEWAAAKQAQRKEAYELIDNTCSEMMASGDSFRQYLDVQGCFDRYSVANAILVSAQMPEATQLKEYSKWKAKAFRMFANINLEVFVDIFTEGYKTDDCENYVRNCFYNLLAFELEKGIPFIERAKAVKDEDEIPDIDDWLSSEDYSHDTEKLSNKMKAKTSTAFLQRLAIKYWKSNNDPELKNHISKLKGIFDKKVKLTALQDYYYDTLVGIMTKGAALWKNDLLDAIILCNVQDLHVMITYDNGVIKRMEKRKSEYPKYLESINVINMLKE